MKDETWKLFPPKVAITNIFKWIRISTLSLEENNIFCLSNFPLSTPRPGFLHTFLLAQWPKICQGLSTEAERVSKSTNKYLVVKSFLFGRYGCVAIGVLDNTSRNG